jgi:dolichol-phosphate mannosyltransferase
MAVAFPLDDNAAPLGSAAVRVLVVLPTYQEAENVAEVLRRVRAALPEADVLVVDDSSPDGTAGIARAAGEAVGGVNVLVRPEKQGLGQAYRAGFRWGRERGYEVLIEMDSDLQHDPSALPSLVNAIDNGADLVIGSRYIPGGSIPEWSKRRALLSKWGNRYAGYMLGMNVHDATSGFRAYRATALDRFPLDEVRADGYGFQIEMAHRVVSTGGTVVEVPITFFDRRVGTSKMSSRIIVEALLLVTWWGFRLRLAPGRRPARGR